MSLEVLPAIAVAAVVAGAVGLGGALIVLAVARRRPALAAALGPLVVIAALGSGVAASIQAMVLPKSAVSAVLWLLVAAVPSALVVGLVLAVRTQRLGADRAAAVAARERDAAAESRRREVVAWISHDLRAPLASVRALAEAAEDGVAAPADAIRGILAENARMSGMVDDLLAYSRLHAPGVRLQLEPVDVGDIVSDVLATAAPIAQAAGVRVDGAVVGDAAAVADPRELSRAVENLVLNGIRHTPRGRAVRADVARDGAEAVVVSVSDGCGGIPEADLGHVFEPGWRGTSARTPGQGGGTGTGLSIVQRVAELHGGACSVENVDGGCRFDLRVPGAGAQAPRSSSRRATGS
ncbi:sensor histidine kinase [Agromyces aurantiacus]|uniref:Sensor-like histidine kinase SenX3 n=1 Tax=Agromyces aurantiacus TaxID=165814 RepID=A0ABV9R2R3_9MICO|nr:HAMP domain-containing sensor histidine kinase [Agromyces aurantiacus]MBM7502793.1 signal transduction histidine kinase [Agromyces aurantiacus]